jgi:hypothetical protein
MKKLLVAVAVVALMASCKKSYVCECTVAGTTTSTAYDKVSSDEKTAAETACNNANSAAQIVGGKCEFKES